MKLGLGNSISKNFLYQEQVQSSLSSSKELIFDPNVLGRYQCSYHLPYIILIVKMAMLGLVKFTILSSEKIGVQQW